MVYNIALDGVVGAGKSVVSTLVAQKLGITKLNTGALYRAIGYYAYQNGICNNLDDKGVAIISADEQDQLVNNVDIEVKVIDQKQYTYLNGLDVSEHLHNPTMSDYSSRVSTVQKVRDHILNTQRNFAKEYSCIVEGRDICTKVLPDAKYKFYLTASEQVRAKRRYDENVSKGIECDYDQILEDVKIRDYRDMNRTVSPLKIAQGAIVIDSTDMTIDQVVNTILSYIKE